MDPARQTTPMQDLASRLYVELVARASVVTEGTVKMAASAESLATMSIRLAEAFYSAEQSFAAAKAPKAGFKLDASDIAAWSK